MYGYWHNLFASGTTFVRVLFGGPRVPFLLEAPPWAFEGQGYNYWHNLLASFSTFVNVARGGEYEPVCTAIHDSIERGGVASFIRWPESWLCHFRWSAGKLHK